MDIKSNLKTIGESKMKQVEFIRRMDALGVSRNTALKVWRGNTNVMLPVYVAALQVLSVSFDDTITVKKSKA